ncbi:MAG: hypothetical protein KDK39_01170 [Leptospiraceae bacterium]|nr:hypothetical protein [Leptospiraceae bacterium]
MAISGCLLKASPDSSGLYPGPLGCQPDFQQAKKHFFTLTQSELDAKRWSAFFHDHRLHKPVRTQARLYSIMHQGRSGFLVHLREEFSNIYPDQQDYTREVLMICNQPACQAANLDLLLSSSHGGVWNSFVVMSRNYDLRWEGHYQLGRAGIHSLRQGWYHCKNGAHCLPVREEEFNPDFGDPPVRRSAGRSVPMSEISGMIPVQKTSAWIFQPSLIQDFPASAFADRWGVCQP